MGKLGELQVRGEGLTSGSTRQKEWGTCDMHKIFLGTGTEANGWGSHVIERKMVKIFLYKFD